MNPCTTNSVFNAIESPYMSPEPPTVKTRKPRKKYTFIRTFESLKVMEKLTCI